MQQAEVGGGEKKMDVIVRITLCLVVVLNLKGLMVQVV